MTEHADTSPPSTSSVAAARAFATTHAFWLTVGAISLTAGVFLIHQLMAWPPHEDETLALFVGRDGLTGVIEHVTRERGGRQRHLVGRGHGGGTQSAALRRADPGGSRLGAAGPRAACLAARRAGSCPYTGVNRSVA